MIMINRIKDRECETNLLILSQLSALSFKGEKISSFDFLRCQRTKTSYIKIQKVRGQSRRKINWDLKNSENIKKLSFPMLRNRLEEKNHAIDDFLLCENNHNLAFFWIAVLYSCAGQQILNRRLFTTLNQYSNCISDKIVLDDCMELADFKSFLEVGQ